MSLASIAKSSAKATCFSFTPRLPASNITNALALSVPLALTQLLVLIQPVTGEHSLPTTLNYFNESGSIFDDFVSSSEFSEKKNKNKKIDLRLT